jgi:pantetheine-phosphate adenylyltransferase
VFPGSFDPPTNGHLNIIHRASSIFDRLFVVVSANPAKKSFFTADKRAGLLKDMVQYIPNVEVFVWDKLIVDFARTHEAKVLIRGVRALTDFGYEFELALVNKGLGPDIGNPLHSHRFEIFRSALEFYQGISNAGNRYQQHGSQECGESSLRTSYS